MSDKDGPKKDDTIDSIPTKVPKVVNEYKNRSGELVQMLVDSNGNISRLVCAEDKGDYGR